MKFDLREFFLMVANDPLPANIEKYVEVMIKIPGTVRPDDYVTWLRYGIERRLGRSRIEGFIYPMAESKVYTPFTYKDFETFKRNRQLLISVLNDIINGENFIGMKHLSKIIGFANSLQSRECFRIFSEPGKCAIEKYMYPPRLTADTPELEGVFALACYGLLSYLADSKNCGREWIKRCAQCNQFFIWKRKDERNRFCSDACRHLYHSDKRKTKAARDKRAQYMKGYRKELKEERQKKMREKRLKRLMDSGYTRKEAEKELDDDQA